MFSFSTEQVVLLGSSAYFGLLFLVAWLTESGRLPSQLIDSPIVQTLALGVVAGAWSFYGVVDLFNQYGYAALAYYMGAGGLFVFAPMLLMPLLRLTRTYQLNSLADLLVFRYRSPFVGALATAGLLLCALPLLALQIQAVADTALIASYRPEPFAARQNLFALHDRLATLFCLAAILFACLFSTGRERHRGLIAAIALESIVKVVALLAVGYFALQQVFGGFAGLDRWLTLHPEQLDALYQPPQGTAHTLAMLFFPAAIVLPHLFQIGLTENTRLRTLSLASWAIPLYLLCLSLPILPILWAGFALGTPVTPEYFTLGVPLTGGHPALAALAYIGGLAAAIGTTVVLATALATLCLNHWLLPLYPPMIGIVNLYGLIIWLRRALISLIILGGYLFYRSLQNGQTLTDLILLSFIGSLQLLPGAFAVLYSRRANRVGLIAGLCVGLAIWVGCLLLPTLFGWRLLLIPVLNLPVRLGVENWNQLALLSFAANCLLFAGLSRLTTLSADEQRAVEQCAADEVVRPLRLELDVRSAQEIGERLAPTLGAAVAAQELQRALTDLEQSAEDTRPYALRRLRERLEANLSGLMGAAVAHTLMDREVPYRSAGGSRHEDLHFVENRINQYRHHLTGLASELDKLRHHHRQTLENLPMAACSLGRGGEVILWNRAMVALTGIATTQALGNTVDALPAPWHTLIGHFLHDVHTHAHKQRIELAGRARWLNLHKAHVNPGEPGNEAEGQIIVIDDQTDVQQLEQELLHSERLASIGRLAAGVAHEIGNPVTGIACLAQDMCYEAEQPAVRDTATQILSQTDRITRIVQSLVHFAHAGQPTDDATARVDLFECVEEAIHLLSLQKDQHRVHYNNLLTPDTLVNGHEQTLVQLFINLLGNARDASPPDSPIDISAQQQGEQWVVQIRDYGHGIPAAYLDRVFEPFFTTKPAGQGTGLGLSLVYGIIEDHGGHIEVKNHLEDGPGTSFFLTLPAAC